MALNDSLTETELNSRNDSAEDIGFPFTVNLLNSTASPEGSFTAFCVTMFIFTFGIALNAFYIFHFGASIRQLRVSGNFPWPLLFQFLITVVDALICILAVAVRIQDINMVVILRSSHAVCRIHTSNSLIWTVITLRGSLCTSTAIYHHNRIQGSLVSKRSRPVFWSMLTMGLGLIPCVLAFYTQFSFFRFVGEPGVCRSIYSLPFLTSSQDIAITRLCYAAFVAHGFLLPSIVCISLYSELITIFNDSDLKTKFVAVKELQRSTIFDGILFFIFSCPGHWCLFYQFILRQTDLERETLNSACLVTASYAIIYPAAGSYFRRLYKMPFFDCLNCRKRHK